MRKHSLLIDIAFVVFAIGIAIGLSRLGIIEGILRLVAPARFIGTIVIGMFYTSLFTAPAAVVALGGIATEQSIWLTAALGGFGAMLGDFIIFKFIRDHLSEDVMSVITLPKYQRMTLLLKRGWYHWMFMVVGAFIIASPLPDELGLTLLGFAKTKTALFAPFSFLANAAGILIIGLVANAI